MAQLPTVWAPRSETTDWFAPVLKLGASLTDWMVIVKVCGAPVSVPPFDVPPLSCAVTVMVATPFAFGAGV